MKSSTQKHRGRRDRKSSNPDEFSRASKPLARSAKNTKTKHRGRRIQVRLSGVHGRGVYALRKIKKGETIIEYKGQMLTAEQADRMDPHDPNDPDHTFFFHIDDGHVIDASVGGNAARWINHACDPNCESDVDEEQHRVFIKALRKIRSGEELFYDYGLVIDEPRTKKLKKQFACRCGARDCRGTMLAKKR